MPLFFARIGALSEVRRAQSDSPLERGQRVIMRTQRGVEEGEIIGPADPRKTGPDAPPCRVLRRVTPEDELLIKRLCRHKADAVEACRAELVDRGSKSVLLDVDHLFDGGTLVMHFLGPIDETAQAITRDITKRYESVAKTREFAELLEAGCGPGCGTEEGAGCSTGGCASCALSGSCGTS